MMILVGYNYTQIALGTLFVSLAVLVIVIAYKKLLQYLGRGSVNKEDFCVLYALEESPSKGEVEFYFTCEEPKEFTLWILDSDMEELKLVKEGNASAGGTIVRFQTEELSNGEYYFCLKTANQKTMKKMTVLNA